MATKRMLQLGEQIRDFIATMLARGEIRDPRVKNITIHSVKMTSDLHIAKVYYVCSNESKEIRLSTAEGLKAACGYIRKEIGKQLQIRTIPQVMFYYDESLEYSLKMTTLLGKVKAELDEDEKHRSSQEKPE